MDLVVISASGKTEGETETILKMFENGLNCFHIRKPFFSIDDMRKLLVKIPEFYHSSIVLHSAHELSDSFQIKGLHFPEGSLHLLENIKTKTEENKNSKTISRSFHSFEDISTNYFPYNYVFLSPIFNSISKKNHLSAFSQSEIENKLPEAKKRNTEIKIYALGGIELNNIEQLYRLQFDGIGIIGSIWNKPDAYSKLKAFKALQKKCLELS